MPSLSLQGAALAVGFSTVDELADYLADVWEEAKANPELARVLATTKMEARGKYRGKVPPYWEEVADCPECGPVYVGPGLGGLAIVGCPWCSVRYHQGAVPEAAQASRDELATQTPRKQKEVTPNE